MIWPRILIGAALVVLALWAGAASRSLWSLPVLIGVFTLAYMDGKNRIWRKAFQEGDRLYKAKALAGALIAETALVCLLFFAAAGVAAAFGALDPRLPFDRLDAGLAAAALAMALLGGALIRAIEGDRDPMTVALEQLSDTLEELDDLDEDDAARP